MPGKAGQTAGGKSHWESMMLPPSDRSLPGFSRSSAIRTPRNVTRTPNSTITKEEAAAMVARAAKLCGLNTELSESGINSALAGFADNGKISAWAKPTLAYCVNSGIIGKTENIQPQKAILRCEIAQMLYNMLGLAELL